MSSSELHLFVFEGVRAESKYVDKLEQHFLGKRISVKCVYDAEIYQLYKQLKAEEIAFDMVNLLKERSKENAELLRDYTRDSFAYIYLFFDYDAHSTLADDDKLMEMLKFFNNETENGLLYVSYPMMEAIRHYKDMESFKNLTVKCKRSNCPYKDDCKDVEACMNEPHYKTVSAAECPVPRPAPWAARQRSGRETLSLPPPRAAVPCRRRLHPDSPRCSRSPCQSPKHPSVS